MTKDRPDPQGDAEPLEFRPDDKGEFDEIMARFADGSVHVETLSNQGCYVGFSWDDGRLCQWWIGCTGRGKLTYNHEVTVDERLKHPTGYGLSTSPIAEPSEALEELLRDAYGIAFDQGAESTIEQWEAEGGHDGAPAMPHKDCKNEGAYQFVEDMLPKLRAALAATTTPQEPNFARPPHANGSETQHETGAMSGMGEGESRGDRTTAVESSPHPTPQEGPSEAILPGTLALFDDLIALEPAVEHLPEPMCASLYALIDRAKAMRSAASEGETK